MIHLLMSAVYIFKEKNQEPILLLGKEEIINDFDKIMNLFFSILCHI